MSYSPHRLSQILRANVSRTLSRDLPCRYTTWLTARSARYDRGKYGRTDLRQLDQFGQIIRKVTYVLMALVRQTQVFFIVAALVGAGWTMSASELWVAAQRAMPGWTRGRMNATVIMKGVGEQRSRKPV
jgi:hypothetical protein